MRPRPQTIDLILANLGRSPGAAKVEATQRSLRQAADRLLAAGHPVLVGQVELNEGDRGYDDWAILADDWLSQAGPPRRRSPWGVLHRSSREGLLYAATVSTVLSSRTLRAGRAVKRQSPPRPVHVDRLEAETDSDDPAVTVLLWHSAAGYRNGRRPALVRASLGLSWHATRTVARAVAWRARRRGDHVAYLADVNDRTWSRLNRAETGHVQHGPDVIGVIPAPGWTATLNRLPDIDTYIEPGLHPGLAARVIFRPR